MSGKLGWDESRKCVVFPDVAFVCGDNAFHSSEHSYLQANLGLRTFPRAFVYRGLHFQDVQTLRMTEGDFGGKRYRAEDGSELSIFND